jgi:hypothetical protein
MKGFDLKKKVGPLPVWAWGIIFGVVGYYVYSRNRGSSTGSASANTVTPAVLDPNAIDPNTGLTYGAEEGAALNANAGLAGGAGTGTVPTDSNLSTGTNELGDLESFLSQFGNIASQLGYVPPGTGNAAPAPPPLTSPAPSVTPSTSGKQTDPNHTKRMHPLVGKGAVGAPSGPKKPPPKKGFTIKGLGGGGWEYVPVRPAITKPPRTKNPKPGTKKNTPVKFPTGANWKFK